MADPLDTAREWGIAALTVINLLFTWLRTRNTDNIDRVRAVETRLSESVESNANRLTTLVSRVDVIETRQAHLPSHTEMADIKQRLAGLEATSKAQQAAFEGLTTETRATRAAIESVRDYLLTHKDD